MKIIWTHIDLPDKIGITDFKSFTMKDLFISILNISELLKGMNIDTTKKINIIRLIDD